jgi:hypothetical protein
MEKPTNGKPWQLNSPLESTDWRPLLGVGEDEKVAYETQRKELNQVNPPFLLRIVHKSD